MRRAQAAIFTEARTSTSTRQLTPATTASRPPSPGVFVAVAQIPNPTVATT